jgi:hypothetical protein
MNRLGWFLAGVIASRLIKIEVVQEKPARKVYYNPVPPNPIPSTIRKMPRT